MRFLDFHHQRGQFWVRWFSTNKSTRLCGSLISIAQTAVKPTWFGLTSQNPTFVDRGHGFFEPRKVETGAGLGDSVIVTDGLTLGERIVVSGNSLIDSESRLKLAAASAAPAGFLRQPGHVRDEEGRRWRAVSRVA